jgi:RNA polymerase sigma-70 factor (ECF subfamily)
MTLPTSRARTDAPDGVLVSRVADGDGGALESLYDRYGPPAFALARRITGESARAQSVVREVFLELWRDPTRYDPAHGRFPSWLLATTHHRAVDAVRDEAARTGRSARNGRAADLPPVDGEAGTDPHGERVRRALGALPPPQRQALVLAYYTGYTQREIAEHTDTPVDTVRTRMVAGMRQLRDLLDRAADAGAAR